MSFLPLARNTGGVVSWIVSTLAQWRGSGSGGGSPPPAPDPDPEPSTGNSLLLIGAGSYLNTGSGRLAVSLSSSLPNLLLASTGSYVLAAPGVRLRF